jgi:hypothetical protein
MNRYPAKTAMRSHSLLAHTSWLSIALTLAAACAMSPPVDGDPPEKAGAGGAASQPVTSSVDAGAETDDPGGGPTAPNTDEAPTYAELFDTYFDMGKPGHCATAGCHADPGHNVWLCTDKDTCYQGMIEVGLINPADPEKSQIADPRRSPLTWINTAGGNMPLDAQGENASARAAILAWAAAGGPKE